MLDVQMLGSTPDPRAQKPRALASWPDEPDVQTPELQLLSAQQY